MYIPNILLLRLKIICLIYIDIYIFLSFNGYIIFLIHENIMVYNLFNKESIRSSYTGLKCNMSDRDICSFFFLMAFPTSNVQNLVKTI